MNDSESADTARLRIVTRLLELRLLSLADVEDVFAYARDPEVSRYTSWPAHTSLADADKFVTFAVGADTDRPDLVRHTWAIRRHDEAAVIGTVGLIQTEPSVAETHFALAKPFWGHGVTTEAVRAITEWAFDHLPELKIIRSGCLAANIGSTRVLEKVGFELQRKVVVRFGAKFNNRELDVCQYVLDRPN